MKTVLLSVLAIGILSTPGFASDGREVDVELMLKLSNEAATMAETLRQSGARVPQRFTIRRSILTLSERISRTAREWPPIPASASGLSDGHRQECRQRAARMMEDTENLVEAIRSLKNKAEAAHDARATQDAKQMVAVVWTLRVTVRKLQRELGDPGISRMARFAVRQPE